MNTIYGEFPFEELRTESGDYYPSAQDAMAAGFDVEQIWSVAIVDGDDASTYIYGPPHHVVNVIGYIATNEKHDGDTYYEEEVEMDDD